MHRSWRETEEKETSSDQMNQRCLTVKCYSSSFVSFAHDRPVHRRDVRAKPPCPTEISYAIPAAEPVFGLASSFELPFASTWLVSRRRSLSQTESFDAI